MSRVKAELNHNLSYAERYDVVGHTRYTYVCHFEHVYHSNVILAHVYIQIIHFWFLHLCLKHSFRVDDENIGSVGSSEPQVSYFFGLNKMGKQMMMFYFWCEMFGFTNGEHVFMRYTLHILFIITCTRTVRLT